MQNEHFPVIQPGILSRLLLANLGTDTPLFIHGAPGVGKSAIVRDAAKAAGIGFIDYRANLRDPVDLRGLPVARDGRTAWLQPDDLPREDRDGPRGILFFDELPTAPMQVQTACFGIVLDRRLAEYRLPSGWLPVAAGNRVTDRAGAGRIPSALADRFEHVELAVSVQDWCQWALSSGNIPPELVAFIRFRPELLHKFDPAAPVNATPRGWSDVAKTLASGFPPEIETVKVAARVGNGPGAELSAFLRIWRGLPSVDAILTSPKTEPVPSDAATLYAVTAALARRITAQTFDAALTYLERLPAEFSAMGVSDAIARDSSLKTSAAFVRWAVKNTGALL